MKPLIPWRKLAFEYLKVIPAIFITGAILQTPTLTATIGGALALAITTLIGAYFTKD